MKREKLSKAAASGAVALIFLVLGFQAAIFTGNVFRYNREHRVDTMYVTSPPAPEADWRGDKVSETQLDTQSAYTQDGCKYNPQISDSQRDGLHGQAGAAEVGACLKETVGARALVKREGPDADKLSAPADDAECDGRDEVSVANGSFWRQVPPQRSEAREATQQASRCSGAAKGIAPKREPDYGDSRRILAEKLEKRPEPELFEFDPNTVTKEELMRLGFSERQAQVIENYRAKGGKYNKPRDFAKMYVVDSAHFARLEPYIRIRKINLNTADSLQLVSLRGIGPYYAHKILEYRSRLGGVFTSKKQLLEIEGIDADRLSGFEEGVEVKPARPRYTLWTATKSELAAHPYIGNYVAKGILRYKSVADTTLWTLSALVENGVLTTDAAARLEYLDTRP